MADFTLAIDDAPFKLTLVETAIVQSSGKVKVSSDDTTVGYLEDKLVAGSGATFATLNPGANEQISISVIGGGGATQEDEFTPTNGQVTFILSTAPTDADSLHFLVNGVDYDRGVDYTISGTTITWLDVPFTMETTDKVIVRYQ